MNPFEGMTRKDLILCYKFVMTGEEGSEVYHQALENYQQWHITAKGKRHSTVHVQMSFLLLEEIGLRYIKLEEGIQCN